MNKKPLIALSAVAVVALPVGAVAVADATAQSAGKPRVSSLDADLERGNVLRVQVDAARARTVKLTYGGQTKTARLVEVDDDDAEREYAASFTPASGVGAGDRVRVEVRATGAGGTTTRTLSDRVEDERNDRDDRFDDDRDDRDDRFDDDRDDRDDRDDDDDDRDDGDDDRDDD